jgi:hypothetical protein
MDDFINDIFQQAESVDAAFVSSVEFGGFDLDSVRQRAMDVTANPELCLQLAIIGALRGNNPRDSDTIQLCTGQSLRSFLDEGYRRGTIAPQGEKIGDKLTLARLSQAFAEPVIQSLMRIHAVRPLRKRFTNNRLPPYMEFMGAGALEMPDAHREEHRVFAQEFSDALASVGGSFNETLYNAMAQDAETPRALNFRRIPLEGERK